jgi:hypothetical protein
MGNTCATKHESAGLEPHNIPVAKLVEEERQPLNSSSNIGVSAVPISDFQTNEDVLLFPASEEELRKKEQDEALISIVLMIALIALFIGMMRFSS